MSSKIEDLLAFQMRAAKLPEPVREYRFHPERRWRFDFCFPEKKLAIECDGSTWSGGRHTRGRGYAADCEKLNAAVLAGFRVLRFTGEQVNSGAALAVIVDAIKP